jgi:hypothetical protein
LIEKKIHLYLTASLGRSLDLTGCDWGLTKWHKDRHRESWGRWVQHSWWEMLATTSDSKRIYLYSKYGKAGWNAARVQSHTWWQLWYVIIYYTILTRSACPVFLARQPCWTLPPLGWVHACQLRGPWHSCVHIKGYFHCLSLPSCKATMLNLAHFLHARPCLLSTKGLDMAMLTSRFLLRLLITGLPHWW